MNKVEELRMTNDILVDEMIEIGHRFKSGKLSPADISAYDTISHAVKSTSAAIKDLERDEMGDYSSRRAYSFGRDRWPMDPDYYGRDRDSMGRYSRTADRIEELRDIMDRTTDQKTRAELQKLIADMERDER